MPVWITSLIFYLSIFAITLYSSYQYESAKHKLSLSLSSPRISKILLKRSVLFWETITVLLPILLGGLRSINVGADNTTYLTIYNLLKQYPIFEYIFLNFKNTSSYSLFRIEFGFQIMNRISYLIFDNYFVFSLMCETIIITFVWNGIKFYHDFFHTSIPLMLYFYFMFEYFHSYNVIRFSISVSIVFYGYQYVIKRKYFHYIFLVLLATSIHKISIFCIIFIIFNFLDIGKIKKYGIWIITIGLITIIPNLSRILEYIRKLNFFAYEGGYSIQANQNKIISAIVYTIILLFPLINNYKILYRKFIGTMPIFGISALYLPLNLLAYYNFFFTRLSRFEMLIMCVLICKFLDVKESEKSSILWKIYYIIFAFSAFIFEIFIRNGPRIYPYSILKY